MRRVVQPRLVQPRLALDADVEAPVRRAPAPELHRRAVRLDGEHRRRQRRAGRRVERVRVEAHEDGR